MPLGARTGVVFSLRNAEALEMTVKKFAISVPEDVMAQVDAAAKRRGVTRSAFISLMLRRLASARRDAEITRRLNEILVDPETHDELTRSARHLLAARKDAGWEVGSMMNGPGYVALSSGGRTWRKARHRSRS